MTKGNPDYMNNTEAQIKAFIEERGPVVDENEILVIESGEKLLSEANDILSNLNGKQLGKLNSGRVTKWLHNFRNRNRQLEALNSIISDSEGNNE